MRALRILVSILIAAVLAPARAQPAQLDDKALRERLGAVKTTVLEKVMSERTRADEQKRAQWLAKFQAIQSEHYLLFTNGPTDTVKKFAVSLERLHAFVKKQFPFQDADRLLECYIFKDEEEYYSFCVAITGWSPQQARGTAGHASSAYYATYYQSPTASVVMHEATHQIVNACLRIVGVGSWFQEGMAVYVERKIGNENPNEGVKHDLKHGDCYPLKEFVRIPVLLSDPAGNGSRNYRHAGALIDFLVNTKLPPVAGKFEKLLEAARGGHGFAGAEKLLREVYGLSLEELDALWRKHLGL